MSFNESEWLANIAMWWDVINPNGMTSFVLNVMTGIVLMAVLAKLSTKRKSS